MHIITDYNVLTRLHALSIRGCKLLAIGFRPLALIHRGLRKVEVKNSVGNREERAHAKNTDVHENSRASKSHVHAKDNLRHGVEPNRSQLTGLWN